MRWRFDAAPSLVDPRCFVEAIAQASSSTL
jgi:hypothetical protein